MSEKQESADSTEKKPRRANRKPRNHRELGQAILAARDPVEVGCGLLDSTSESVKARALETVTNWAFGPPDAAGSKGSSEGVRIVWDLLGLPHEEPSQQ